MLLLLLLLIFSLKKSYLTPNKTLRLKLFSAGRLTAEQTAVGPLVEKKRQNGPPKHRSQEQGKVIFSGPSNCRTNCCWARWFVLVRAHDMPRESWRNLTTWCFFVDLQSRILFLLNQNCQTLGDVLFVPSLYRFESWQITTFAKQNLQNCWNYAWNRPAAAALKLDDSEWNSTIQIEAKVCNKRLHLDLVGMESNIWIIIEYESNLRATEFKRHSDPP